MKIYTQEVAINIINAFEDLLDEYNISIPDEDRTGDEGEARIYGMTFAGLLDTIEHLLIELMERTNTEYIPSEWNGGNWIG